MKKIKEVSILILAVLLVIIAFFIDSRVLFLFKNLGNSFVDKFMLFITNFTLLIIILFLIPAILLFKNKKYNNVVYLWFLLFTSIAVSFIIKNIVARPRPIEYTGYLMYSFPSLHTMAAFAAIPILDKEFPKLRLFWISFAFFVAVSRLYFNFHYLSDVVAGALIGYSIGLLFIKLEQKYNLFKKVKRK